jgi:hypothetical protein
MDRLGRVTDGSGHGAAEDAGGSHAWEDLKAAYKAQNTRNDEERYEQRRGWYERSCENGDLRGLKGRARLNAFSVRDANRVYDILDKQSREAGPEEPYDYEQW